jgi:hypothetical protein
MIVNLQASGGTENLEDIFSCISCSISAGIIMRVSSAYWIMGYFCPKSLSIGRLIRPLSQASFTAAWSKLAVLTKRRGREDLPVSLLFCK